jgi:hypothetical protein
MTLLKETLQLANPSPAANGADVVLTNKVNMQEPVVEEDYHTQLAERIAGRGKAKAAALFPVDAKDFELDQLDALFTLVK